MLRNKKAALSPYIVMGMILVIAIGFYFIVASLLDFPGQIIEPEFEQVKVYTEKCMEQSLEEALVIMGMQGGYIELPNETAFDPNFLFPGGNTPFWYYQGTNYMPTISGMTEELEQYLETEVMTCIDDFKALEDQYAVTAKGNMETEVEIGPKAVTYRMTYPVDITSRDQGSSSDWEDFLTVADVPLGETYELARQIMEKENEEQFLENITILDLLPAGDLPTQGFAWTCEPKRWTIQEIKDDLDNIFISNYRYLRFEGTKYDDTNMPYKSYYDANFLIELEGDDFSSIEVKTMYDQYDDYTLKIEPSNGDIVEPVDLFLDRITSCIQLYNHKYTFTYPLMFQLRNYAGTEPYFFQFATPVIVIQSLPGRTAATQVLGFDDTVKNEDFCENTERHKLRIYAVDENTGNQIRGANITYQCVRFNCEIGATDYPMTDDGLFISFDTVYLEEEFPACGGGVIIAKKEGYLTKQELGVISGSIVQDGQEMNFDNGYPYTINMIPLREFNYDFRVAEYQGTTQTGLRPLEENETALITLTNNEQGYQETIIFPDQTGTLGMMIGEYTYDVDIKLVQGDSWLGGYEGEWTPSRDDILSKQTIIFKAAKSEAEIKDFEQIIQMINVTEQENIPIIQ